MAKIKKLPGQAIIDGFKGTLDFYVYMGINCVRKWPRSPGHNRAPAVQTQWPAFAFAGSYYANLPAAIREAYAAMVKGSPYTGRDLFTSGYITRTTVRITEA